MGTTVQSILDFGMDGLPVDIECHLSNGLPNIIIVGFAGKAVEEARERVRSAFANSHIELPRRRITINLAPGDIQKEGTSFDLAIATAILVGSGQVKISLPEHTAVIGELSLDGSVRAVRGIIGKLVAGQKLGFRHFIIPEANLGQAELVPNIKISPVGSLREVYMALNQEMKLSSIQVSNKRVAPTPKSQFYEHDFKDIVGQKQSKRALEIAAAGAHNVLLNGPPGAGKSMLARALPSILPPMTQDEMIEVTHLHSLANRQFDHIVQERPFRTPHHSASDIAIIGGGQSPRPGEISLSHRGVLFFDEFPEFSRSSIEALRQPLEDRIITVARAKGSITFPANFVLVATANPCPCGYFGTEKSCQCLPYHIMKYQRRLSGPIIDRIDMFIDVEDVAHEKLLADQKEESSHDILQRVIIARQQQAARFGNTSKTNSDMDNRDIKNSGNLSPESKIVLNKAAHQLELSARSYMRAIKVARTIADLSGSPSIEVPHITEALHYRRQKSFTGIVYA